MHTCSKITILEWDYIVRISVELMGSLVDYLPDSDKGQATLTLKDKATISDLLQQLQMRQKVIVAVNGEQEKDLEDELCDGDEILVFTGVSGG